MYEGFAAKVTGKRSFLKGDTGDRGVYQCRIVYYDSVNETVLLTMEASEENFCSLDSTYDVVMDLEDCDLQGQGYVRERYCVGDRKTVLLQIQNGFYKNPKNDKNILTKNI